MPRIASPRGDAIEEAVQCLRRGEPVAFPTETVYGLGADTFQPEAIRAVFRLKDRPADNPLIAHVSGTEQARPLVRGWDERCDTLASRFWPGPLTLVLSKDESVPEVATAGWRTIAVRAPRHPVASALLAAFGGAISAPSANRSGHVSPTTAQHVADDFSAVEDLLILDGGRSDVGIESTVLDLTGAPPRILRPGSVTGTELKEVLGEVTAVAPRQQTISPGTSAAHYAPHTPAELVDREELMPMLDDRTEPAFVICFDRSAIPPPHQALVMPQGAADYVSIHPW